MNLQSRKEHRNVDDGIIQSMYMLHGGSIKYFGWVRLGVTSTAESVSDKEKDYLAIKVS